MDVAATILGIAFFVFLALLLVFLSILAFVFFVRLIKYLCTAPDAEFLE